MIFEEDAVSEERALGERYDSEKIHEIHEGRTGGKELIAELFAEYSATISEDELVIHETTAIIIAEAVMRELYPDDNYGVITSPYYYQPNYYKEKNCWEVILHKNGRDESIYYTEKVGTEMLVYVDINNGAVRAIFPEELFSIHHPANAHLRPQKPPT